MKREIKITKDHLIIGGAEIPNEMITGVEITTDGAVHEATVRLVVDEVWRDMLEMYGPGYPIRSEIRNANRFI